MPILFYYAKPHLLSHKLWLKILILKALSLESIFQALSKPDINAEIEHGSLCHHYLWSQKYNAIFARSGEKLLCCITLNYGDILIFLIFWQNNKAKYASSSARIRLYQGCYYSNNKLWKIKAISSIPWKKNTFIYFKILIVSISCISLVFNKQ